MLMKAAVVHFFLNEKHRLKLREYWDCIEWYIL